MSNSSLKKRIAEAIEQFEQGKLDLAALRSAVVENGSALEAVPYALIKELNDIEYKLTCFKWYKDEDCQIDTKEGLKRIKKWLAQVPE